MWGRYNMKKILLIIALAFCIFQMVVLAVAIDMGNAATDRASSTSFANTWIDRNNPANATGTITSIEIYIATAVTGLDIGIFYVESGDTLSTRDDVTIGALGAGYHQVDVDLDVVLGDYIGYTKDTGTVDVGSDVSTGEWYVDGDYVPCTSKAFTQYANRVHSLYATGATPPAGITWNGVTITKWNGITITKINGK